MVDLVKIRKKAREQKETEVDASSQAAPPSEVPEKPATRKKESADTKKKKSKRATGSKAGKKKASPPESASPAKPIASPSPVGSDDELVNGDAEPRPEAEANAGRSAEPQKASESTGESRLNRFKRTAGIMEQEAEEVEGVESESADGLLELLTFSLAGELYSIDVDKLVEIIVPRSSTRVPNASAEVIGIISLRGSIVTLLDLRKVLGHSGRGEETEDTRIVVIQHENERIGFTVDKVLRVVKVDPDSIEPHPVVSVAEQNDTVHGVFVTGDTITIYLDLDRIAS